MNSIKTLKQARERQSMHTIIILMAVVAVLAAATILSYNLITNRIIESAIDNMQELALHDEQAIQASLKHQWSLLEGIGKNLQRMEFTSTDDLLFQLRTEREMIDCIRLLLIADDGEMLSNDLSISTNPKLFESFQDAGDRFAYRQDALQTPIDGHTEVLVMGVRIQPFTLGEHTFTHLVCLMDIDALQSELKIDSFDGRGYTSVIDQEGYYVVKMASNYSTSERLNLSQVIQEGKLDKHYSSESIQELLRGNESFSVRYTNRNGDPRVISFTPMQETNWWFIMSVSRSVFEEQSMSLISIFSVLLAMAMAIIIVVVFRVLRRRAKMLDLEIKHREELADALELAQQANRAKTIFLSNMSHDIRTPMNAIIGFTALATTHAENTERVRDYLSKISQASTHLLSLINDVLDMSRIESGKMHLNEHPENLPEILHNLRNIIQADIQARHLQLYIDTVDVSNENILCDRLRLNQIFLNLMSNAIKFTPEGGTVSLRIIEKESPAPGICNFEFRVKDTGIGMSPEFLETVFEPFTRERNSTVSGIQGTGLGMAITKNIVDLMHGSIKAYSEQGKGTEFVVSLSFKALETAPAPIGVIGDLKGLRALVVDDDIETCQSVAQMLRQVGMRPEWTSRGREAVARAREASEIGDSYKVYILDWQMPDMGGLETAEALRNTLGDGAPIIFFSAYDWTDIVDKARTVGVTDFISKPLFASELHSALLRACGKSVVPAAAQDAAEEAEGFDGKRILLAEDNELNREIAMEILGEVGLEVEPAENGQIAFEMLRDSKPGYYDLVLMDVQMPVMNGYDATRAIRALENPALASIPIIAMTANAFEEDKRNALEAGMNGHLGKPIDVPALMEMLSSILKGE